MDAAGKPHTLQIDHESLKLLTLSVTLIMQEDSLQSLSNAQIVLALLIERDVASHQGSFRKTVNIHFLVERQVLKSLQLIAEHLDVGKSLMGVHITFCHFLNLYF